MTDPVFEDSRSPTLRSRLAQAFPTLDAAEIARLRVGAAIGEGANVVAQLHAYMQPVG